MTPRILVGTRKGLFDLGRSADGSWKVERVHFLGDPVTWVLPERGGRRIHAALDHGHFGVKLHRSEDGGVSFAPEGVPVYPEQPEGSEDLDPMRGTPVPWSLKTVWALAQGTPDQPGRLWCGTIPGGLFRSDDGGEGWELVRSLWDHPDRKKWMGGGADHPGIHSICVDPRDGDHVLVGVSCGGAWETRDGGASWSQVAHGMRADFLPPDQSGVPDSQDPHCIVMCAAQPDVLWCQHHCGIFRRVGPDEPWQEISGVQPSAFGFAVAVHPRDPDTAWFVPAVKDEQRYPAAGQVVVTRTRDGGRSFEVLREGLPQQHAYDLVYRHALDVDSSGELLALGSTTGSLWVGEQGGERFVHVSAHLPPVYCVRFLED